MPAQGSVHNVQRAPHQTLGTRTRRRGRADAARSEPASYASAPRPCAQVDSGPDQAKIWSDRRVDADRSRFRAVFGTEKRFYTVWVIRVGLTDSRSLPV